MKPLKLILLLALFVAGGAAVDSRAQSVSASSPNSPAKERFLVIVETSAAMQKRAENTQKALGSVISSGLNGQVEPGCTIGLWTFNETLFTGQLPLQLWTQASRQRVALTMVQFLQQQKNDKAARLAVAWEVATNIVAQSERITVLLFTSGSDPVVGTPFDVAIAASFKHNADQQHKGNMPFLTILRAVNGKFVSFVVNMPPWPLEVPEWPEEFKPAPAPPQPKVEPVVSAPPPVLKRPDPSILSPTNTIYLVETSSPVVTVVASAPPTRPTNPVVIAPSAPVRTNVPVVAAPVETKPKPVAEQKAEPKPAGTDPGVPPRAKLPVVTILVAGICVLLGVLVVFIALLRWSRRAAGESLITRSMHRDDR